MLPDPVDLLEYAQNRQYELWLEDIRAGICPRCGSDLKKRSKYICCTRRKCGFIEHKSTKVKPVREAEVDDIPF